MAADVVQHELAECDRQLRADPAYSPSGCEPAEWTCVCGRKFVHVCDEAEGCFYAPADGTA
jgi:hypothetical protein